MAIKERSNEVRSSKDRSSRKSIQDWPGQFRTIQVKSELVKILPKILKLAMAFLGD